LHACMRSILQQDFANFEVLIIDDHNNHQSLTRLLRWQREDSRIKILPNLGRGLVDALNTGLHQARGEFVARMDGDDIMQPDRLSRQLAALVSDSALDLIASRVVGFSHSGLRNGYRTYLEWQNSLLSHEQICEHMYVESTLAHPSVVFRRWSVLRLGGYRNGDFPEDYDLWLRMMQNGSRFAKLPQYLLFWRDDDNRTSRTDARYQGEKFDRLRASYLCRDTRLPQHRPLWFWGAGRRTRKRVALLIEQGIAPSAWIDVDPKKIGRQFYGKPVYSPESLALISSGQESLASGIELNTAVLAPKLGGATDSGECRPFVVVLVNNHGAKALVENFLQRLGYRSQRDYLLYG